MFNKISEMQIPEISSDKVSSDPLCDKDFFFVDTNSQYKHIFIRSNTQKHPIPWRLANFYYHRT